MSKVPKQVARIKAACEQAKIQLSNAEEAVIEVDEYAPGKSLELKVTRAEFEGLADGLFKKSIPLVQKALDDAKVEAGNIDEIVLVGGSCRIPRVQKDLAELFGDKALNFKVNPDEAVAHGATILAA